MGVGRQVDISLIARWRSDDSGCGVESEKLGDVDVAVNQGSVDPETIFVKYSNERGRLSAST
jgi:hypothetical protein